MSDPRVLDRIAAWEAGGLIDAETAERLRAHEAAAVEPARPAASVLSAFGPTPTIAEAFAYVGGGFILAAWYTLVSTQAAVFGPELPAWGFATGFVALVTIALGLAIRGRGPRHGRATGVLFAVGVANIGMAVQDVLRATLGLFDPELWVLTAFCAMLAAAILRRVQAGLLTQGSLITAILVLTWAVDEYLAPFGSRAGMLQELAIWLLGAVALGVLGLVESRGDLDAGRRAALSRFAAGMTAVIATSGILISRSSWSYPVAEVEAWLVELGIALVSAVVLGLAIRRGAAAYLYPAALGFVIALTHMNSEYIADQVGMGVALLIEGVVLVGAGLGAQRIRRLLLASGEGSAPTPEASAMAEPDPPGAPMAE